MAWLVKRGDVLPSPKRGARIRHAGVAVLLRAILQHRSAECDVRRDVRKDDGRNVMPVGSKGEVVGGYCKRGDILLTSPRTNPTHAIPHERLFSTSMLPLCGLISAFRLSCSRYR